VPSNGFILSAHGRPTASYPPARRKGNHEAHRARRIGLRPRGPRHRRQHGSACYKTQKTSARKLHGADSLRPFHGRIALLNTATDRRSAAFRSGLSQLRVISVGSTRFRCSRHVRYPPFATELPHHRNSPLSAKTGREQMQQMNVRQCRYSITSSAATSRPGGTVRPSALAVLRLTIVSNLVAACTGRSAGLSPRRIRST
jgi:hypothetical protein